MDFVNSSESDNDDEIEIFEESDSSTNSWYDPEIPHNGRIVRLDTSVSSSGSEDWSESLGLRNQNDSHNFQKENERMSMVFDEVEEVKDNSNRKVVAVKKRVKRPSLELYIPGSFSAGRLSNKLVRDEREEARQGVRNRCKIAKTKFEKKWSDRLGSKDNRFIKNTKMSCTVKDTYRPDEKLKYFNMLHNLNGSCSSHLQSPGSNMLKTPSTTKRKTDLILISSARKRLPKITPQMEEVILRAERSRGNVLVDSHNIQITRKDMNTLHGNNWLNDAIINFYLQMIAERSNQEGLKVYATSTFFYPKMMSSGQPALKRWTKGVDIFEQDLILIPVYLGMHWCLAVVDFRKPGVYYYDSMGGNNMECLNTLLKYLQDEYKDKKGGDLDMWRFESKIMKNIPQQMNGSDCGMFTCKFAEYISRDAAITFNQKDIPYFRKRMIWEIVQDTLLHP